MENPETRTKVPNSLCQQILNHELELQTGNITEDLVSKTIQLYVEAMSIYMNHNLDMVSQGREGQTSLIARGHQFYQQKIKKLLLRKDVHKCLLGFKTNPKATGLQLQLDKVQQSAPEQAKALVEYFKKFHKGQQQLIKKTLQEQNNKLDERIARRSRSRSNGSNSALKENNCLLANINLPNMMTVGKKYTNLGTNLGLYN